MELNIHANAPHYIGLDLGDKVHAFAVFGNNQDRKPLCQGSIPNTAADLTAFAAQWPGAVIALEVGQHSPWISRLLKENNTVPVVANARKLEAITKNIRKSDRNDAVELGRLVRCDPTLLSPVEHVAEAVQLDRVHLKVRRHLVTLRTRCINAARSLFKSFGLRMPTCTSGCAHKHARLCLEQNADKQVGLCLKTTLGPLIQCIEHLNDQIKAVEEALEKCAKEKYPVVEKLAAIQGVGPVTALNFVLTIGDPERFKERPADVGAYLGLVPGRDQSGATDKDLPITKAGNCYARALLVQSAQYIMGPFGPPCDLRAFGERIQRTSEEAAAKKNQGKPAKGASKTAKRKAVVAVARKLSVVMLGIWRNGTDYKPFMAKPASTATDEATEKTEGPQTNETT